MSAMVCVGCQRPGRKTAVKAASAPGTVPIMKGCKCKRCCDADSRQYSANSLTSASLEMSVTIPDEDIAAVRRLITSRYPNEPELLEMLGIAS